MVRYPVRRALPGDDDGRYDGPERELNRALALNIPAQEGVRDQPAPLLEPDDQNGEAQDEVGGALRHTGNSIQPVNARRRYLKARDPYKDMDPDRLARCCEHLRRLHLIPKPLPVPVWAGKSKAYLCNLVEEASRSESVVHHPWTR